MRLAVVVVFALSGCMQAGAPQAPLAGRVAYACDSGRQLVVEYNAANDPPSIDINVDGPEMLLQEPDTGAVQRYSWPSDGSFHIWELSGGVGTLRYRDGEAGTTATVLTNCRAS